MTEKRAQSPAAEIPAASEVTSTFSKRKLSANDLIEQQEKTQDLGFGTKINESYSRLINKDGSFNVRRVNEHFWDRINLYHRLITIPWFPFLSLVLAAYLIANSVFAGIYMLVGVDRLHGLTEVTGPTLAGQFWGAFFFSAQTLTTVGYGHMSPIGYLASGIAAFESMLGLLAFALATGLLYGRFSRPIANIRFSKKAVFAPYQDMNGWMFRIVNERYNQLIDIEVEVSLSRFETKPDGTLYRHFYPLPLERNKVTFFPLSWTLVHPITADSPLFGVTQEQIVESKTEFLILLRAINETFSQTVNIRSSYRHDELEWGQKFRPMFSSPEHSVTTIDLNQLDSTDPVLLNE